MAGIAAKCIQSQPTVISAWGAAARIGSRWAAIQAAIHSLDAAGLDIRHNEIADCANNGDVNPGTSPGILTVTGDYSQATPGELNIEIGGYNVGTQFDRINISETSIRLAAALSSAAPKQTAHISTAAP